jgi:hypothetical protein
MTAMTRLPLFLSLSVAGIFHAYTTLDAQQRPEPRTLHSQTQDGIAVRIEKVTVQRIFNEPAWIEAREKESKTEAHVTAPLRRSLPPKEAVLFVSVVGDTKMLGPTKVTFADNQTSERSGTRFFSPPKWQPRLPQLAVDPEASGIETRLSVSGKKQTSDLFPAQIQVQVTTVRGQELTFVFRNVEF